MLIWAIHKDKDLWFRSRYPRADLTNMVGAGFRDRVRGHRDRY